MMRSRTHRSTHLAVLAAIAIALTGCGQDDTGGDRAADVAGAGADAGGADAGADAGGGDAGSVGDAAAGDAGAGDAVASDTGAVVDAGTTDSASADAGTIDAVASDAVATDVGDAVATDAGDADAGDADAGTTDTGTTDVGNADAGAKAEQVPPAGADLAAWLGAGHYTAWAAEPAPHVSSGPHFGKVRVFFNDALLASLKSGGAKHPVDAVAVKELYGSGSKVLGWSLIRKLPSGDAGGAWHWYEVYQGKTFADAPGATLCTGCHSPGKDYVLSPAP